MAKTSGLVLLALCMAFLWSPARIVSAASAEAVNPCRSAKVTATAGDSYLDLVYLVSLSNPTDDAAGLTLLQHIEFLEKVEGVTDDLVLNRQGDAMLASVPSGWKGDILIRAKAKITDLGQSGTRTAFVALPPAVSRSMEFNLPGRNVGLEFPRTAVAAAGPCADGVAMVTPLGTQGERSRFSVVPLSGGLFQPEWRPIPPPRPAGYSLRETHRITENVPAYVDDVTLDFLFAGTPPAAVRAALPQGVTISRVQASDGGRWKIAGGMLEITVPDGFAGDHLTLRCRLDGASTAEDAGAQLLAVPLFGSPDAGRHTGTVTVNGGRHELAFSVLEGARQTAAEGWRLACEFEGAAVRVAVRVVPMAVRRVATVETHYAVSEYRVVGAHRITLKTDGELTTALTLLLPPATTARSVTGDVRDWSQEGGAVRIETAARPGAVPKVEVTTESLTGGRLKLELAPPTVAEATTSEYTMAVTHVPEVQLKTALAEAPWRVTPDALPAWLRQLSPPVAYHYRDAAPAVELEALPVEAELRGTVQDHVAVSAERVQRDTLFLIDIQKRALSQVELLLQPGFTAESVEGPYVESWDVGPDAVAGDGSRVTVRFPGPLTGGIHFRLVSSGSTPKGTLSLFGVRLAGAPALHGWLGIGTDVSTRVRPLEDGRANLASVRTDQAPAYLAGFGNRFVYEFYSTDWQLDMAAEGVPPVYDAEVLNVLSFSASGVVASAFLKVNVAQGGLPEVELRVPAGAATPQVEAPDAVMVRWSEGIGLVRFRGPRTGAFSLRVDYTLPTGAAAAELNVEPVRVTGARSQSGVLLLVQARPDVDVKAAEPPRALQPAEAEQQYPGWSYRREHPALAAYGYRDADWRLSVSVAAHPLSEQVLPAIISRAKLDTLLQDGGETLNHLHLVVVNTTQQFFTVDLAKFDPQARLIGTYISGQPVKPFRQGKTVLELPLFANETASLGGISVSAIDITYAAPASSLTLLRRNSFQMPDLGLNASNVEWTVRLPQDYRLTAVGGNLDKPVSGPPPVRGLAARLVAPVVRFAWREERGFLALFLGIACLVVFVYGLIFVGRLFKRPARYVLVRVALVLLAVGIIAAMMMPALERARREALKSNEKNNLHQLGLALNMYRNNHQDTYPVDFGVLIEEGDLGSAELLKSPNGPDVQLVYRRPAPNADSSDVVAYFLRPGATGANVLYVDGTVQWVDLDSDGNLKNPRAEGQLIAGGLAMAYAPTAPAEAGRKEAFAGAAVKTEELAEALQLGQQMTQQRAGASANQRVDQTVINEALVAANRDKIESAKDQYAKEHGGQQPGSAQDISGYIADARLRQALREQPAPVLERARREARISNEAGNLHSIHLGISMYRTDHGGEFPADLQAAAENYVPDQSVFTSPAGPDVRLVYTPPGKDAKPTNVVAYFWGRPDGANVLYADGSVQWVPKDASGNLSNPRDAGRLIAGTEEMASLTTQAAGDQLARSRYSLGNAYMQRGDYDEAEKQFADALKLDASNDEARRGLDQLRALRSEVKDQLQGAMMQEQAMPQSKAAAAPAAPASKRAAAKGASDLKSIEKQLEEREMAYKAAGPQGGPAATAGGLVGGAMGRLAAAQLPLTRPTDGTVLWGHDIEQMQAMAGPGAAAAPQEVAALQPRLGKASLVRQVAGGRSIGALPIPIDFPAPATVSYEFVKPFLGRAEASVSFRVLRTGSVMLLELALAAAALVGYALLRRRAPRAGAGYAAVALAVSLAGMAAAPVTFASAFGAAALTMGVCLAAEVIHLTFLHIHAMRTGS